MKAPLTTTVSSNGTVSDCVEHEGEATQIPSQKDPIICDTLPTKESLLILCASVQSADTPLCHKAAHYRYRQLTLFLKEHGHDMEVFTEMERISTLKGFWPEQISS